MQIAIATSGLPFHGHSLKRESLGGSETAVICVARELAKLGHNVRVYCECNQHGNYDGVQYFNHREFLSHMPTMDLDVLIASRWPAILTLKTRAAMRILWCHDMMEDREHVMPGLFQTDRLFLLSDFHIDNHCSHVPHLRDFCIKTSNGVDLDVVNANLRKKILGKLIYTSRPERGLIPMLKLMPKIVERHPEAKLYYATYKQSLLKPTDRAAIICAEAERLAATMPDNVIPLGNLSKSDLYAHISSSALWTYPTNFQEIFCIGAIEAQACGTPIVTTNDFALRETVGKECGILIDGVPGTEEYDNVFVDAVCGLLTNDTKRADMSSRGQKFVTSSGFTWDAVAKQWDTEFRKFFAERWAKESDRIVMELRRSRDLVPAKHLADEIGDAHLKTVIQNDLERVFNAEATADDCRSAFRDSIPLFQEMAGLLLSQGKKPAKILEVCARDDSFGLFAAKAFPNADVVVLPDDMVAGERISSYALKANLLNLRVLDRVPDGEEFDLIVSKDTVDAMTDPYSHLRLLGNIQKSRATVIFTARSGSNLGKFDASEPGFDNRMWNLSVRDFSEMLDDCECNLRVSFFPEGTGKSGDLLGHWICFADAPFATDPKPLKIEDRKSTTRPYRKLAVCMITKNEQQWLHSSLETVRDIADEIIIADSGSTDDTKRIAMSHGAEVRNIKFDNFAQARNASIAGVDSDWILWIDADERLVGGENIRRYIATEIYEGFSVKQVHLMLDKRTAYDLPARIFRKRDHYKFTGLIHEQIENVAKNPFDDQIEPLFIPSDVDIAHFGYISERIRRRKSSNRNMELLIRDVQESKTRLLTWVLVMRDYINIAKWHESREGGISAGSVSHDCLSAVILTYHNKFANTGHRYAKLSQDVYQEALHMLGKHELAPYGFKFPPFEAGLTLVAAAGGVDEPNIAPNLRWYLCADELKLFLDSKVEEGCSMLFGRECKPAAEFKVECGLPNPIPILEQGKNLFTR